VHRGRLTGVETESISSHQISDQGTIEDGAIGGKPLLMSLTQLFGEQERRCAPPR